jgi:hypothetical protein
MCFLAGSTSLWAASALAEDAPRSYVASPDICRVIAENDIMFAAGRRYRARVGFFAKVASQSEEASS